MITRTDVTLVSIEREFTHTAAPGLTGSITSERAKVRYADELGQFLLELPRELLPQLGELITAMAEDVDPVVDPPEQGSAPILDGEEGVS